MKDLVPNSRACASRARRRQGMPTLFLQTPDAGRRFWEFFTANIRNRNTRQAYFVAVSQFSQWCEGRKLALETGAADSRGCLHGAPHATHSKPTVKQHLAAIRMLFDWLVTGQVMPMNPAHAVRGRAQREEGEDVGARRPRRCVRC